MPKRKGQDLSVKDTPKWEKHNSSRRYRAEMQGSCKIFDACGRNRKHA